MTDESAGVSAQERENLSAIADMENRGLEERSFGERISDAISNVASTPSFAVGHLFFFAAWVITQSGVLPSIPVFDPFPFTFLTFIVSLEAIFLSIFVLVSQSRMTRQADRRSHLDLQVNLLAEQESTSALKLLYAIAQHLEVPDLPLEKSLASKTSIRNLIEGVGEVTE
jgi:uncharacterized membrane protein